MSHPINFDLQIAELEERLKTLKRQRATYLGLQMWYVSGGEYTDTTFSIFKDEKERYGPFVEWEEAMDVWRAKSWANVDSCHTRYEINRS